MKSVTEYLRELKRNHEKLKKENFKFNEREKAKAELVESLLNKIDSGKLISKLKLYKNK
jgi:FtsZ-binding cell division protein ZapB